MNIYNREQSLFQKVDLCTAIFSIILVEGKIHFLCNRNNTYPSV